jgi:DNA-directed RNA polymerase specialized sigma24 family protein
MAQLSPEHRAVLDLVFYQGLSLQELPMLPAVR